MARTKRIYRVIGTWPDGTTQTRHYQTKDAAGHRAAVWMSPNHGGGMWPPRADKVELYESEAVTFGDKPSLVYTPSMWGRSNGGAG